MLHLLHRVSERQSVRKESLETLLQKTAYRQEATINAFLRDLRIREDIVTYKMASLAWILEANKTGVDQLALLEVLCAWADHDLGARRADLRESLGGIIWADIDAAMLLEMDFSQRIWDEMPGSVTLTLARSMARHSASQGT